MTESTNGNVPKFKCENCDDIHFVYDLSHDGFCEECQNEDWTK